MKRIISLVLVLVLVLSTMTTVFGQELDLVNTVDASKSYGFSEIVQSPVKFGNVGANPENYLIEFGTNFYKLTEVIAATAGGASIEDAVVNLTPVPSVEADLKVVSVSAINATDVTVKFAAPVTEEQAVETTLTFVKGTTEYAATATLVENATETKFTFATALTEDGEYTLKGTEVKVTLSVFANKAAVDAVNAARNTTQLKVLAALQNPLFNNVDVANISEYDAALSSIMALVDRNSAEKIQKLVIDGPNAVKAIAAAVTASNQIKLNAALVAAVESGVIVDYNADLISQYRAGLVGQTASLLTIQTAINTVNTANTTAEEAIVIATQKVVEAEEAIAAAGTFNTAKLAPVKVKILSATNAVTALTASSDKTALQARMAKVLAIETAIENVIASEANITVAGAKATATLSVLQLPDSTVKTALQARIDAYAPVVDLNTAIALSIAAVEAELLSQNTLGFAALTPANRTAAATVIHSAGAQTTVKASKDIVYNAITSQTLVQKVANATTEQALLLVLKEGNTTKLADGTTPLLTAVVDANSAVYKAVVAGYTNLGTVANPGAPVAAAAKATVANIQTIVTNANLLVSNAKTAVATFKTDKMTGPAAIGITGLASKASVEAALTADVKFKLAEDKVILLPNTLELGKELYATIYVQATEETLNAFVSEAAADKVALLAAGTVKTALLNRLAVVKNVTDINGALSAAAVKTLLDTQKPAGYEGLTNALKVKFATAVWNTGTDYASVTLYKTALKDQATIQAVNNATTPVEALDALTPVALTATASADFIDATSVSKQEIATLFLNDDVFTANGIATAVRTSVDADGDYTSIANIKTDLNKIAAAHKALLANISIASVTTKTITSIDAQLVKLVDFGYEGYDDLSASDKLVVAEKFLELYPVDGDGVQIANSYRSATEVAAAVDAAIMAAGL